MKIIGLIGGSGCGKSSVATILAQMGLRHIDCDEIARQVVEPDMPCLQELVSHFGNEILLDDGRLNRKELAARAFTCTEQTQALNRITHKYILAVLEQRVQETTGKAGVVIDGAALAESGYLGNCDCVIAVLAPMWMRLRRIMRRDGLTHKQAWQRLRAQKSNSFYKRYADYVVCNGMNFKYIKRKIENIYHKIFS